MRRIHIEGITGNERSHARGRSSVPHSAYLTAGALAILTACSSSSSGSNPTDAGNDAESDALANVDAPTNEADAGVDSGAATDTGATAVDAGYTFAFQPSNVRIADIGLAATNAKDENVAGACVVETDPTSPQASCFTSPVETVTQTDGSTVNMVVVKSLVVASNGSIRVTGKVPLVVVSLSDVTISGIIDASSKDLNVGPGGAGPAASNAAGLSTGGGAAGSASAAVGGSGGSYCGVGGMGGGQTVGGTTYGSAAIRPLVGGSAGGGGAVGSGAGGGAIQITAAGMIAVNAASSITVGGEGGPIGGIASNQNAGGGGSGGSILLEATAVTVAGTLAANGGGGGGDYSGAGGANATPNATLAAGGAAGADDGAGGNGAAASTINGGPGQTGVNLNAGGGGGASGRIRINSMSGAAMLSSGILSPDATTACVSQGPLLTAATGP
jgi:hypothetical protein